MPPLTPSQEGVHIDLPRECQGSKEGGLGATGFEDGVTAGHRT